MFHRIENLLKYGSENPFKKEIVNPGQAESKRAAGVLVLDCDETLIAAKSWTLLEEKRIREILAAAQRNNIIVAIVTGRSPEIITMSEEDRKKARYGYGSALDVILTRYGRQYFHAVYFTSSRKKSPALKDLCQEFLDGDKDKLLFVDDLHEFINECSAEGFQCARVEQAGEFSLDIHPHIGYLEKIDLFLKKCVEEQKTVNTDYLSWMNLNCTFYNANQLQESSQPDEQRSDVSPCRIL